jgi:hypothetical protein
MNFLFEVAIVLFCSERYEECQACRNEMFLSCGVIISQFNYLLIQIYLGLCFIIYILHTQ